MRFLHRSLTLLVFTSLTVHAVPGLTETPSFHSMEEIEFAKDCAPVEDKVIPGVNLDPNAKEGGREEACDDYYYAPEGKPDYKAARECAVKKNDRLVLMMLYANGYGVPRDVSAALKLACMSSDGEPEEIGGRAHHLAAMLSEGSTEKFDECNDITSEASQGHCAAIGESFDKVKRSRRRAALIRTFDSVDKVVFAALEIAKNAYLDAHEGEIDDMGPARRAMVIEERAAQDDNFLDTLALLESGKFPAGTQFTLQEADKVLNQMYQADERAQLANFRLWFETLQPRDIEDAELAWLKYRDAWVTFVAQRYPAVSADSIKTYLTDGRAKILADYARKDGAFRALEVKQETSDRGPF